MAVERVLSNLNLISFKTEGGLQNHIDELQDGDLVFTPDTSVKHNDTEFIAHQAMPSSRYVSLTLGASGATYTAPADGYFALSKATTADGQFIQLGSFGGVSSFCWSGSQYNACATSIPVQKGQTITIDYTAGGNATFRFYYANGAQ